jgi:SNF2 family DNA or RNA helicase
MLGKKLQKPSEFLKFKRKPWEHQTVELDLAADMPERALLWEMGTGKTGATINWLRWKYSCAGEILPTLILSPVATLFNWAEEFEKNATEAVYNEVGVAYFSGSKGKEKRLKVIQDKKIVIANYETLTMDEIVAAYKARGFQAIVCDEAQRLKNPKSKRLKGLLSFSDRAKYRSVLTGTLILNKYMDIWAPWRFLDAGKTFGTNYYSHFLHHYFEDKNKGMPPGRYFPNWLPKNPNLGDELAVKIARKASRKTKKECLDLPEQVFTRIQVEMAPDQKRMYEQMEKDLVAYISGEAVSATNALVKIGRMLQILSGYVELDDGAGSISFKENPRLDILSDLLEDIAPENKVVIWCIYRKNYEEIRELCKKLGFEYAEVTGDTKDKQADIARFRDDPKCRVMISNPKAGGVGVGFQASNTSIYYSRSHALEDRLQSLARNHRGGSEIHDKITVIDLVTPNTLDEEVLQALIGKEEFAEAVLERVRSIYERKKATIFSHTPNARSRELSINPA